MGSLTSSAKAPSPQVVYVPAPLTSTPVSSTTPTPDPVQDAADARKNSLLVRDRGRFGTVLTGFRGFLAEKNAGQQRKTLLGE